MYAQLLKARTTNTDGSQKAILLKDLSSPGLVGCWLEASGTFDGATVSMETLTEAGTWVEHVDTRMTTTGVKVIELPSSGVTVRGKVTGAGGSTNVNLVIR